MTSKSTLVLALVTCLVSGSCDPSAPTEAQARSAYPTQKATLDAVDAALRGVVAKIPHFGIPPDDLPCTPPPPAEASKVPGLEKLVAGMHCNDQQLKMLRARDAAIHDLEPTALKAIVEGHRLIGLELTYTMPSTSSLYRLGRIGFPSPTGHDGTVRADKGISIDGRQIGWGLYRKAPDGHVYRPGLEVAWQFQHEQATVRARASVWMRQPRASRHRSSPRPTDRSSRRSH